MKGIVVLGLAALALAGSALAGVRGAYIEARTADVYTGACFANSEAGLVGELAVMGWKIDKGSWQGVSLDGLSVVGVIKANSTLGDISNTTYPVKSVLIIDEKATPEQRLALRAFAQRMGGDLLNDVARVEYQPVELTVEDGNPHNATATLTAGALASIRTRAVKRSDLSCSHEEVWYPPLTKVGHFMPAIAVAHSYQGEGLGTKWSSPDKRSAFVADFQASE
ncbi:MAG: DUF1326 domain-containing protein [Bryobacterales bacterium]|nr:DUF1326 domain-containing protein [Bryobacterales bacterium]